MVILLDNRITYLWINKIKYLLNFHNYLIIYAYRYYYIHIKFQIVNNINIKFSLSINFRIDSFHIFSPSNIKVEYHNVIDGYFLSFCDILTHFWKYA